LTGRPLEQYNPTTKKLWVEDRRLVLFDELADLGPVVLAEVDGGGDDSFPHKEGAARERQRVARWARRVRHHVHLLQAINKVDQDIATVRHFGYR
jgi:hypothetical protein